MSDIGSSLREARMRAKIDITEVEQATKIRAKYLRALENEEWNLLPGSTFVKSFLREYAKFLGLDARHLVDEYKLRYERPSEHELAPISPAALGGRDRRGGGGGGAGGPVAPRWAIVGGVLLLVVAALWAVGSLGGGDKGADATTTPTTGTHTTPVQRHRRTTAASTPTRTTLRIVPTGSVYVCLVDQTGKVLIPGSTFAAGQTVPVQHARGMRLTLGNNQVQLRLNGHPLAVAASSQAIGFKLTPKGAQPLAADAAPTCS